MESGIPRVLTEDCVVPRKQISNLYGNKSS